MTPKYGVNLTFVSTIFLIQSSVVLCCQMIPHSLAAHLLAYSSQTCSSHSGGNSN